MVTTIKNYFQDHLADMDWLMTETSQDPELMPVNETLFSIGNGYIGSRGVYEELPPGSHAGTYFAGVFDQITSLGSEMVNAPNPFKLSILVKDEKLGLTTMNVAEHRRILDLKHSLLCRNAIFKDQNNQLYEYQSLRLSLWLICTLR